MKILVIILLTLTLSGCGFFDRYVTANVTGYAETCVDGVLYYQFPSGVTVAYNTDGSVKACK